MKCQHKNCKREAVISDQLYFKDIWYCAYHAKLATIEGRRLRKYGNRNKK